MKRLEVKQVHIGFRAGVVVTIMLLLLSLAIANLEQGVVWSGTLGLCLFASAALISGIFTSSRRLRSPYIDTEDLDKRQDFSWKLFKAGLPGFIILLVYYWDKV